MYKSMNHMLKGDHNTRFKEEEKSCLIYLRHKENLNHWLSKILQSKIY